MPAACIWVVVGWAGEVQVLGRRKLVTFFMMCPLCTFHKHLSHMCVCNNTQDAQGPAGPY